ncbi:MAG: hypothetical protein FWH07_00970 [Oscillospiraceae bacterium]|nr:hypothetical protein [Oscillospiraceae bacterium]
MKKECKIYNSITGVSDDIVQEAKDTRLKKAKKIKIVKWAGIAAALVLIAVVAVYGRNFINNGGFINPPETGTTAITNAPIATTHPAVTESGRGGDSSLTLDEIMEFLSNPNVDSVAELRQILLSINEVTAVQVYKNIDDLNDSPNGELQIFAGELTLRETAVKVFYGEGSWGEFIIG